MRWRSKHSSLPLATRDWSRHDTGPLIILSGPSGGGKSTVIRRLLAARRPAAAAVGVGHDAAAAAGRDGRRRITTSGRRSTSEQERDAGGFLEWAEVHGNCYGTLRSEVDAYRQRGHRRPARHRRAGGGQVRRHCPDARVDLPDDAVAGRCTSSGLRQRGTEDEAAIARRLADGPRASWSAPASTITWSSTTTWTRPSPRCAA